MMSHNLRGLDDLITFRRKWAGQKQFENKSSEEDQKELGYLARKQGDLKVEGHNCSFKLLNSY